MIVGVSREVSEDSEEGWQVRAPATPPSIHVAIHCKRHRSLAPFAGGVIYRGYRTLFVDQAYSPVGSRRRREAIRTHSGTSKTVDSLL